MEDPRLSQLRDRLIDGAIEYLQVEVNDKSLAAARSILKDLSPREGGEGMTDNQAQRIKDAMGEAPYKFGS